MLYSFQPILYLCTILGKALAIPLPAYPCWYYILYMRQIYVFIYTIPFLFLFFFVLYIYIFYSNKLNFLFVFILDLWRFDKLVVFLLIFVCVCDVYYVDISALFSITPVFVIFIDISWYQMICFLVMPF